MVPKLLRLLNQWMAGLSVFFIFIIVISVTADVVMRYVAGSPIIGVVELNRTLLVIIIFFTLGYTQFQKKHINIEFVLNKFSNRKRTVVVILNTTLSLVVIAVITYGAVTSAVISTVEGEHEVGILNYPVWPGRIAMAFGLFVLCCQYVIDIIVEARSGVSKREDGK